VILTLFERPFTSQKARIRNVSSKAVVKDLSLKHGVLISFEGNGQNELQYEIPKASAKISESIGRKITICFSRVAAVEKSSPQLIVGKTPSFGGFNLTSFAPKNLLGNGSLIYESPNEKNAEKSAQNIFGKTNYQSFL
jgi:hypothetical protein